jgi:hypothetical protein
VTWCRTAGDIAALTLGPPRRGFRGTGLQRRLVFTSSFRLKRRRLASNPGQASEIVGEIAEADLGPGAGHAEDSYDQAKPVFLSGKDVGGPYSSASKCLTVVAL